MPRTRPNNDRLRLFAAKMRRLRLEHEYEGRPEAAAYLGVDVKSVQTWENGKGGVDDRSREKIIRGYGWDPWQILQPEDYAAEQALDELDAGASVDEVARRFEERLSPLQSPDEVQAREKRSIRHRKT